MNFDNADWIYDIMRKLSICQRCGTGIYPEYIGTHDYFHANIEPLAGD